jgi:exodeoxyribonuclease VII large subunit
MVDDLPEFDRHDSPMQRPILTVVELNQMTRRLLESNLPLLWVQGEISNFIRASSGHWYFSLKDESAQVRCTFFRNKNQFVDWQPENGAQVELRALPTLYEARGDFQLNVEVMRRAGLGALYEAFEKLKAQLDKEGLFDARLKKPVPRFPRTLGIVTSTQTAALRDVLTTLHRRMPGIRVLIYPTSVQGKTAGPQIADSIHLASRRNECDALILCRGGGSIEDLWCFNDEIVARAIAACPIPIISGVGHETDFTIADFVVDLRAPTPTAAAEICSPSRSDWLGQLDMLARRTQRHYSHQLENQSQLIDGLGRRLKHPAEKLNTQRAFINQLATRLKISANQTHERKHWHYHQAGMRLAHLLQDIGASQIHLALNAASLKRAMDNRLKAENVQLSHTQSHLQHLNPQAVLERGYSITQNANGEIVRNSAMLKPGEPLLLSFAVGKAQVKVESKNRS